jgi:hypothetical protein
MFSRIVYRTQQVFDRRHYPNAAIANATTTSILWLVFSFVIRQPYEVSSAIDHCTASRISASGYTTRFASSRSPIHLGLRLVAQALSRILVDIGLRPCCKDQRRVPRLSSHPCVETEPRPSQ